MTRKAQPKTLEPKATLGAKIATESGVSINADERLAIQEAFARMNVAETRWMWEQLTTSRQRSNFIWIAFVCLAQDDAINVLKTCYMRDWATAEQERIETELRSQWQELADAEGKFAQEKATIMVEVANLRNEVQRLQRELVSAQTRNQYLYETQCDLINQRDEAKEQLAKQQPIIDGLQAIKTFFK